jgi:hypothetical protein
MARENVRVKSVHFNLKNELDAKMFKSFSRKNFSRYVKKLIWEDIEKNEKEKQKKATIKQSGGIQYKLK